MLESCSTMSGFSQHPVYLEMHAEPTQQLLAVLVYQKESTLQGSPEIPSTYPSPLVQGDTYANL